MSTAITEPLTGSLLIKFSQINCAKIFGDRTINSHNSNNSKTKSNFKHKFTNFMM